ncbi:MAG: hypothetical protein U0133_06345 [Gemmatimonadales bacterium]
MRRTLLSLLLLGGRAHWSPSPTRRIRPSTGPSMMPSRCSSPTVSGSTSGPRGARTNAGCTTAPRIRRTSATPARLAPATGGTATALHCPASGTDGPTVVFENPASDGTRPAWVQSVVRADAHARPA